MAFKFIGRSSSPIFGSKQTGSLSTGGELNASQKQQQHGPTKTSPPVIKLTNAQLNKMAKALPVAWLRDSSGPKQLPAIYQGVLGQVQLQPAIGTLLFSGQKGGKQPSCGEKMAKRELQMDYMNRFTDTERVYQLLSASMLPNETLATIWAHVNQTYPGQLTNREVCLALALIAIFQRLEKDGVEGNDDKKGAKDPFNLVKLEKKPPVPKLYPLSQISPDHNLTSFKISQMTSSKSTPNGLNTASCIPTEDLLVDFGDTTTTSSSPPHKQSNYCERIRLTQTWLKFLAAMKSTFKRSFDILNVEHGRHSTLEALKSPHGQQFAKHLCLCYPLAHNIKTKIESLSETKLSSAAPGYQNNNNKSPKTPANILDKQGQQIGLFDKDFINQVEDLMVSINEYWAVLINLFHESGQTRFIELIMDSLIKRPPLESQARPRTIDELAVELSSSGKPDVCSICHTQDYLALVEKTSELDGEDVSLLATGDLLAANDNEQNYYYHARCANFWLNQVDPNGLPFQTKPGDAILSPVQ